MIDCNSQITIISGINTEWEFSNLELITKSLIKKKISCNLFLLAFNQEIYRRLSGLKSKNFSIIRVYNPLKNYLAFLTDIIAEIEKRYPLTPYFVLTTKNKGEQATTLRDISFLMSGCLINIQHGEGYDLGYSFSWKFGWKKSTTQILTIAQFFYNLPYYLFLNFRSFFALFFIGKKNKNYFLIKIIFNKSNFFSPDIRYSCDFIFLNSRLNYDYLLKTNPALQKKLYIAGSFLAEKFNLNTSKNHNVHVNKLKKVETILFYTSGAFKYPKSDLAVKQKKIIEEILLGCKENNFKLSIKCKLAENFFLDKFIKANSNNKNILSLCDKSLTSYIAIIPTDSTVCLKYLLQGKTYFTYNLFKGLGYIGELNKFYKRPDIDFMDFRDLANQVFDDNNNLMQIKEICGDIKLKPSFLIAKEIANYLKNF